MSPLLLAAFVMGRAKGRDESVDLEKGNGKPRPLTMAEEKASQDRTNFFQFTELALDELPVMLRKYFKIRWAQAMGKEWTDDASDGEVMWYGVWDTDTWHTVQATSGSNVVFADPQKAIVSATHASATHSLSPGDKVLVGHEEYKVMSIKGNKIILNDEVILDGPLALRGQLLGYERNADSRMVKHFRPLILAGDCDAWDISLLCFALLNSSHELLGGDEEACQHVRGLRKLRNNRLAHVQSCRMQTWELNEAVEIMDRFVAHCLPGQETEWKAARQRVMRQSQDTQQQQSHQQQVIQQGILQPSHTSAQQQHSLVQQQQAQFLLQEPQESPSFTQVSIIHKGCGQATSFLQQESRCRNRWHQEFTTMALAD